MHKITRTTVSFVAFVAAAGIVTAPTLAYKRFAVKEGVNCAYCHNRASGGGARNYRGAYYDANMMSFVGFDDAAEAKKAGVEVAPGADQMPASLTPKLADATVKAATAKTAYDKSAKDDAAKKAYAVVLAELARSTVFDPTAPEKTHLADAAKINTEALTLDPMNASALKTKAILEKMMKPKVPTTPSI